MRFQGYTCLYTYITLNISGFPVTTFNDPLSTAPNSSLTQSQVHDMADADASPISKIEKNGRTSILKVPDRDSDNFDFGGESNLPPPPTLSPEEERKLWRKIDLRLMPILSLMYLFSFLDRGKENRLTMIMECGTYRSYGCRQYRQGHFIPCQWVNIHEPY